MREWWLRFFNSCLRLIVLHQTAPSNSHRQSARARDLSCKVRSIWRTQISRLWFSSKKAFLEVSPAPALIDDSEARLGRKRWYLTHSSPLYWVCCCLSRVDRLSLAVVQKWILTHFVMLWVFSFFNLFLEDFEGCFLFGITVAPQRTHMVAVLVKR